MEEKILTAEELLDEYLGQSAKIPHNLDRSGIAYADHNCTKVMIEFAKLHVTAALKAAARRGKSDYGMGGDRLRDTAVSSDLILSAYPLKNIK